MRAFTQHDAERLDTLDGSRTGRARRKAAVRIEDLAGLLELPQTLSAAKAAGATPTQAEFDALLADVRTLHRRLTAIVDALQARILP